MDAGGLSGVMETRVCATALLPEELREWHEPRILRGFVKHWPAVDAALHSDNALCDYLGRFDAGAPVVVYKGADSDGRIGFNEDFSGFTFERGWSSLAATLDRLLNHPEHTLYMGSTPVDKILPGFRSQNDISLGFAKPLINFWLGNESRIATHFDSLRNIACCVAGRRTFTLFPPEQVDNLYIGPVDLTPSGRAISLVNLQQPDYDRYPKFAQAMKAASVAELEPGDALFIPPLWWHHVHSQSPLNMLVNYWWRDVPEYRGVPDLALEHAILALRGLPLRQREAWRTLFEHYVFSEPETAAAHIPEALRGMLDPDNEEAARLGWINLSKKINS